MQTARGLNPGLSDSAAFERSTRPLLELVQRLTGLETSFVTSINWAEQVQEVVLALNSSVLEVVEGSVVAWSESMCRWTFLGGRDRSSDVQADFPGSLGAEVLGMQSFFAVPILAGDHIVGTVCGASRDQVTLTSEMMTQVRLIAESLSAQMANHVEHQRDRRRADHAEVLAMTDSLTGLPNHRAFTMRLEEELARSARHGSSVSLLVIDIDAFKAVNDTYGHEGGNDVLCVLADVLRDAARAEDVAARLGGDEFALLLPGTHLGGAIAAGARIAEAFCCATGVLEHPATLSTGASSTTSTPHRSLVVAADEALYRNKQLRGTCAESSSRGAPAVLASDQI